MKWTVQKRIEAGTYKFGYPPYGYKRDENGNLMIHPVEANAIRLIFTSALNGMGTYKISKMLQEQNIPTRKGGRWSCSTVKGILEKEKYYGAAMFQKTYTDSGFKRHKNYGEVDSYFASEHHEPIISKEVFNKVQLILQRHIEERNIVKNEGKYHNKYAFSGKIICGECGSKFKRQTQETGIAWACTTHLYHRSECSMKFIKDTSIKAAFVTMLNKLVFGYKLVLSPYYESICLEETDESLQKILDIKTEMQQNVDRKMDLRKLRVQGIIDSVIYNQELSRIEKHDEEHRTAIDEKEAVEVISIFNGYLSGMSLCDAAKNAGENFVHSTVKRILRNTRYVSDDFYPAIISRQTFARANAELLRRSEEHMAKKRLKPPSIYKEFAFSAPAMQYENPVQQAEYIYSLIGVKNEHY